MDSLKAILDAGAAFGVSGPVIGLLFWLLTQERAERKALALKLMEVTSQAIEAERDTAKALEVIATKLGYIELFVTRSAGFPKDR